MPDIQHSVQIAAEPEAIHPLVATADGFRKWWAADVTETNGPRRPARCLVLPAWPIKPANRREKTIPEILHRIGVNAPIAQVYEALTASHGISSRWTRKGTPQVGSEMEMRFNNDTLIMQCRIEELKPNALIKWCILAGPPEWIGSTIQFALAANGDETVVLFSHLGWKEIVEYMYHGSTKWGYYMFSLRHLPEDGRGTPHPTSSHRANGVEPTGEERRKCQFIRSPIIE